jgi:hypothetical protein
LFKLELVTKLGQLLFGGCDGGELGQGLVLGGCSLRSL